MKILIEIKRQEDVDSKPYIQCIEWEIETENLTIASLLREINADLELKDVAGNSVSKISWECSCLQKKCGACAILINGRPGLACDAFIKDNILKGKISLAPLSKFPVIKDLIVDRSVLYNNLKDIKAYIENELVLTDKN